MINKTEQYNWQKATKLDKVRFGGKPSPNVLAVKDHLIKRYGGSSVGIVAKRDVRGGGALSTHYFGAAIDWRYTTRASAMNAIKELVAHSQEWGIQMIVDYVAGTVWTPKKGWRKQEPNKHGMGQAWAKWLHIETTKTMWGVSTPLSNRL